MKKQSRTGGAKLDQPAALSEAASVPSPAPVRRAWWAPLVLAVLLLLTFRRIWDPASAVEAGDAPVGTAVQFNEMLKAGATASTNPWQGLDSYGPILLGDFSILVYRFLPVSKADEFHMALFTLLTALGLYGFLRDRRHGAVPALVGALAAGFSTSLISLAKAGHVGKFGGFTYLVLALWAMQKALRGRGWSWALLGGVFVGYALAWGRDTAVVVALGVGVFWLWELFRPPAATAPNARPAARLPWWRGLILLGAAGVVALVMATPVLKVFSVHADSVHETMSPQQHWEWATQWSLPGDELLKLVVPSYTGWDSWHGEAPYWGRMGRSAGWSPANPQAGFRNFTQTNEYVGIVVVLLALLGVLGWRIWPSATDTAGTSADAPPRGDVWVWLGIALVALLLAMGSDTPLYRLFYSLPMMGSMRNPVKFMHLVSLALAILAAHGAGVLCAAWRGDAAARAAARRGAIAVGVVTLLLLAGLIALPESAGLRHRLATEGFGAQWRGIQATMRLGLGVSLAWSLLLGLIAWAASWPRRVCDPRLRALCAGALVTLVALDFAWVNGRYVNYYPWEKQYQSNPVIAFLKDFPDYRVKFLPHNWGIFNYWNGLLTPYHRLRSADAPAASRMRPDLAAFLEALSRRPARLWQLLGVRHLVLPRQLDEQVRREVDPAARVVLRFDLAPGDGVPAIPVVTTRPTAAALILQTTEAFPVARWYGVARAVPADEALNLLADDTFPVERELLLESGAPVGAPPPTPGTGVCSLTAYGETRIAFTCRADAPGWVCVNDAYDPRWEATVNGQPAPVWRAQTIFRAVAVPAGESRVELVFRDRGRLVPIQLGCAASALIVLALQAGLRRALAGRAA